MKKKSKEYNRSEMSYILNVGYTCADVALMTGRTAEAIKAKRFALAHPEKIREHNKKIKEQRRQEEAERLGGRDYKYWSKEEIELIMCSNLSDKEISEQINRTINSIQKKRHRLMKENWYGKNKKKRK